MAPILAPKYVTRVERTDTVANTSDYLIMANITYKKIFIVLAHGFSSLLTRIESRGEYYTSS
jgi:hypothetical protein